MQDIESELTANARKLELDIQLFKLQLEIQYPGLEIIPQPIEHRVPLLDQHIESQLSTFTNRLTLDIQYCNIQLNIQPSESQTITQPITSLLSDCDGKKCGQGRHVASGHYVCPHNNLAVKCPDLMKEWHRDNKVDPNWITLASHKKIKWFCSKNKECQCHVWEATIRDRVGSKSRPGTRCPFCSSGAKQICDHNNFKYLYPSIAIEWHPTKNGSFLPNQFAPCADRSFWWKCTVGCECHEWETKIKNRIVDGTDCPFCFNNKVCKHNNLEVTHPKIAEGWHPTKNGSLLPKNYTYGSNIKVWWICNKSCECHEWPTTISHRTRPESTGCPFCSHRYCCKHNNLTITHPDLVKQWNTSKNGDKLPEKHSHGSGVKIWWKCIKGCDWKTRIVDRVKGYGCPHCSKHGYSMLQIEWLISIETEKGIKIQKATDLDGEYKILGVGKVDGYCIETNTVYEYHGDFWHGNPLKFDHDNINPVLSNRSEVNITYGELYNKTSLRDRKIRALGYTLITKWTTETPEFIEEYNRITNNYDITHVNVIVEEYNIKDYNINDYSDDDYSDDDYSSDD